MVDVFFEDTPPLSLSKSALTIWLNNVCLKEGYELGELTLILCSDDYLLKINKEHLNHDYYTDIITFDYSSENLSGDLFISIDRVRENAINFNQSFFQELHRVIVHGLLHLIGYGDKSEEEALLMRKKENEYLSDVPRETNT